MLARILYATYLHKIATNLITSEIVLQYVCSIRTLMLTEDIKISLSLFYLNLLSHETFIN